MGGETPNALLLGALALLLVSAGIQDARTREIANWKNLAIAVLAPLWWWANGLALWPDMGVQLGVAAIVFGFFCGAFALGWMGGGDVKMIGALALWFPFGALAWMLIVMSLIGGALTLLLVIERAVRRNKGAIEIPYGVAIAMAALLALREPILNQFL
ncbi:MAG: peptidase [Sphingomonas bacterium]|uniref:A24 family peptidase n=1 Tax=Sphingomonas bacterium TaxID=1895847 RepID=UPI002634970A|nr:prepilin peptidase [Sphingomonas bacterium]MDB5706436.1 peptidase [Sphingomonas bacterium]